MGNMTQHIVSILSNITIESLALRLRKDFIVSTFPGFNTWQSELLNPDSVVWNQNSGTLYLVIHGLSLFAEGVTENFQTTLDDTLSIIRQVREEHREKTLVVSTLDLPKNSLLPLAAPDYARQAALVWRETLEKMDVPILDLAELAADFGRERFYNAKTWYFGALPFSAAGERLLAAEIVRIEQAVRMKRKKCLVLDLDHTLWGGVIGEDGLNGIALGPQGVGAVFRDVQKIVKELAGQGVLLAVASKNNVEDALSPFRKHPHAVLREEDFVCFKANWEPKPSNIARIAEELNIGRDSLVFVDDNPVEREAVRLALPEVAVPDFPEDTASLPAFFRQVASDHFTTVRIGAEDVRKTAMYRAEGQRAAAKAAHISLDSYLESLEMRLDFHSLREEEIPRAAQLCAKTNQFNLTTRRHTEDDIASMMRNSQWRLWIASLEDRFGDYGRIALIVAKVTAEDGAKKALIDTFLMSCRVMGRGVENALIGLVEQQLEVNGVECVVGQYLPTSKNTPVQDFWSRMGYTKVGENWELIKPFAARKSFVHQG